MARKNCIVTDNGTYFDRDTKRAYTNDGYVIADLYGLDIGEMSDDDLIIITVALEFACSQGRNIAQERFATKVKEVFGL